MTEDWSRKDITVILGLYITQIAVAFYFLISALWLALIYLSLWIVFYAAIRWIVCTKCQYYGKRCILEGGRCATLLFKKREGVWTNLELNLVEVFWVIITLLPILGLYSLAKFYILALFLGTTLAFHFTRMKIGCLKCKMRDACPNGRAATRIFKKQK